MPRKMSLKILGPFEIESPPDLKFATRKVAALVACLALPPGRRHSRGGLADLLWGSRDESHARHSLNQALSSLRKALERAGVAALICDGDTVALDPDLVATDVSRLNRALEDGTPAALADLMEIWRGDLLAGFDLREDAFEEWLVAERVRVRGHALDGFLKLLDERCRIGAPVGAIEVARAILKLDPAHEPTHLRLMELYAMRDQRNLALKQYRECAAILRRDFDVAPSAETRALHEQLQRGKAPAAELTIEHPTPCRMVSEGDRFSAPQSPLPQPVSTPPRVVLQGLVPIGGDPVETAIASALGDDLLTALSRDRCLDVVDAGGTFGSDEDPLHGLYLLDGSVRGLGDAVRVTVRISDASSRACLWSEHSDIPHDDVLRFDLAFAQRLTTIFRREIETVEARKALAGFRGEQDPWRFYHLGLREMYRFSMPSLDAARCNFEQAVELDPDLAAAYARLAYVYLQMCWYWPSGQRAHFLDRGIAAALQAVGLDSKSAQGHFALGRLYAIRGEFDLAIPELETAIGLDSSFAQAQFGLGQAFSAAGDPASAVAPLDRAIDLDPQDPHLWTFYHDRAEACFALGDLAEAEKFSKIAVRLPNATHFAQTTLTAIFGASRNAEDATTAVARLRRIQPDYTLDQATDELAHHANREFVGEYLAGLEKAGLTL